MFKDSKLEQIQRELVKMADLVQKGIVEVTDGLVNRNRKLIESAKDKEQLTDVIAQGIEKLSISSIALYQPVSRDLRLIASSLFISSDFERIGDLILNIADASLSIIEKPPLKPYVDIPRMCETLVSMIEELRNAMINNETTSCDSIAKKDTIIDSLYHKIWRELLSFMIEDVKTIEIAETILHIAKQYERIGDHITNIAERICYIQTGKVPDLNE